MLEKSPPPPPLPGEERSGFGDRLLQELLEGVASSSQPFCSMSYCTILSTMSLREPSSDNHESCCTRTGSRMGSRSSRQKEQRTLHILRSWFAFMASYFSRAFRISWPVALRSAPGSSSIEPSEPLLPYRGLRSPAGVEASTATIRTCQQDAVMMEPRGKQKSTHLVASPCPASSPAGSDHSPCTASSAHAHPSHCTFDLFGQGTRQPRNG